MPAGGFWFLAKRRSVESAGAGHRSAAGGPQMRYNVVGQNRDTGSRMSLEFEAESKAAAERKAAHAGMSVHHVTDVTDGDSGGGAPGTNPAYRGPVRTRGGGLLKLVIRSEER